MREIARAAGISMGKLYTYYPTKEDLFTGLVENMGRKMELIRQKEILPWMASGDQESLRQLGMAIGRVVSRNLDYWRLMYVDVVEFRHKHFIRGFREVAGSLRKYSEALFQERPAPFPEGVDPGFAYFALYLQFFTYFLVERLGARRHLGLSDEEAVARFVRLCTREREGSCQSEV